MATERTYVMLKPGVIQRRIMGEIVSRFERKGLRIIGAKLLKISDERARDHYKEHEGKSFYQELIDYITSAPVLALAIEGDSAIMLVRKLVGPTKVEDAPPGTIRGDYSKHTGKNIIHASDSPESAARELGLFFAPDELIAWNDGNACWY